MSKHNNNNTQQPKLSNLQRFNQIDNGNYKQYAFDKDNPNYVETYFCCRKFGITSTPCLLSSGLQDCVKHWNMEWDGGDLKEE